MANDDARMLAAGRHALAEHKHNTWFVTVEPSVTKEDLLRHGFWAHVGHKMRPCDEILVYPDHGEWRIHLHVIMTNGQGATVAILNETSFIEQAQSAASDPVGYDVKWAGPHAQYRIVRRDTGEIVREGIPTKDQAFDMIRDIGVPKAA